MPGPVSKPRTAPCAGKSVTLVAPPAFELAPVVYHLAARHRKSIRRTSLERFSQCHVDRLRKNYMVRGKQDMTSDTMIYDAGAERALREPLDLHHDLVPRQWRSFGLD